MLIVHCKPEQVIDLIVPNCYQEGGSIIIPEWIEELFVAAVGLDTPDVRRAFEEACVCEIGG